MKKRFEYIDTLKGFAILCVIWGHSIQFLRNNDDSFKNPIFEFIYSFHMPLFFFISGYFFMSSLKIDFIDFIKNKFTQLLLPCLMWGIFVYIAKLFLSVVTGNQILWLNVIKSMFYPNAWPFWFFQELFKSYVLVFIFFKVFKKDWLAFLISILFVLIVPFCDFQRFLIPVFWAGIFLRKYQNFLFDNKNILTVFFGICFFISLIFWKGDYTIYVAGFPILFQINNLTFNFSLIDVSIFRLFIGLSGSMFFFLLFYIIFDKSFKCSFLKDIGTYSLAIYILQATILEYLINRLIDFSNANIYIYNFVITPFIAICVAYICLLITKIINKNKRISYILFGSSYIKK